MSRDYYGYWGKARPEGEVAYHLLPYHCLDVAAVGHVLLTRDVVLMGMVARAVGMSAEKAKRFVLFLIALHDLGKFADAFQSLARQVYALLRGGGDPQHGSPHRHDALGFALWLEDVGLWLFEEGPLSGHATLEPFDLDELCQPLIKAVTGHHGTPPGDADTNAYTSGDKEAVRAFITELADLFGPDLSDWADYYTRHPSVLAGSFQLAGLTMVCDWLGSNQRFFPYKTDPVPLTEYWTIALERATVAVDETRLIPPLVSPDTGMARLFPGIERPRPLQVLADCIPIGTGPHLFIVEDMTGSGKTEAALALGQRLMALGHGRGFYFAMPTMATADQMYDRVAGCFDRFYQDTATLVLAHGKRMLSERFVSSLGLEDPADEDETNIPENASTTCSRWLADNAKKSLLAAIGVGTVDQIMLAVLLCKHFPMRLWGLSQKALIIDEVHAYDTYMTQILERVIELAAHWGRSVILLSATLPVSRRTELIRAWQKGARCAGEPTEDRAYPAVTHVHPGKPGGTTIPVRAYEQRTIPIEIVHEDPTPDLIAWAEQGRNVCWICNTVDDARERFAAIRAKWKGPVTLFHARFVLGDRIRIQDQLLEDFGKKGSSDSRHGRIVIATPVVEQSLDIDFDWIVSDLAPIDLLIQRMGRMRRHVRDAAGRFNPRLDRDGRPAKAFTVLAPPFTDEPEADWFSEHFPRAANIYVDPVLLWRTCGSMRTRTVLSLPEDVPALMSAVYEDEHLPEGLEQAHLESTGRSSAHKSAARLRLMDLEEGYTESFDFDESIATRLGLATETLRLARWNGETLIPFHDKGPHPWSMSEVRVFHHLIDSRAEYAAEIEAAYQSLSKEIPGKNRNVIFAIVEETEPGHWVGRAAKNHEPVTFTYSRETGLTVEKNSTNEVSR